MNIFISYAREDYPRVEHLHRLLKHTPGITTWLDTERLIPGLDWKDQVMSAIRLSDVVIVCLSTRSVNKTGFVQKEIREAIEKAKCFPPGRIAIIPIRLDECAPQHPELERLQWIDMFPDADAGLRKLALAFRHVKNENKTAARSRLSAVSDQGSDFESVYDRKQLIRRLARSRDFRSCDLMRIDLSSLDLRNVDFTGANLVTANLTASDLRHAMFDYANLERADCRGVDPQDARLHYANLWKADVTGAKHLGEAEIAFANIYQAAGLGPRDKERLLGAKCFEARTYHEFLSQLESSLGTTKDMLQETCRWLLHGYFRDLFSDDTVRMFYELLLQTGPSIPIDSYTELNDELREIVGEGVDLGRDGGRLHRRVPYDKDPHDVSS